MNAALVGVPAAAGVLALLLRADAPRRALLVLASLVHLGLSLSTWRAQAAAIDLPARIILSVTSVLFFAAAVYAVGYLAREDPGRRRDFQEDVPFANQPEAVFTACLLAFLATMSLVCVSRHFGLLWVAVEATTLASAPLIYFHRHHRSLEATWKYLLVCSVGIAIALLGNFFLAVATQRPDGSSTPLHLDELLARAGSFDVRWLQAAFLLLLVGYGTKMGLAPLHTWLPDAHSEAPSVVSALLSGALLNCAYLGILRAHQVCAAAGLGSFSGDLLVGFGLLSMVLAAAFVVRQPDYKRLLAYSSVEHMGILALGTGLGAAGTFGALLHAVNHSLAKGALFLVAGNILAAYRTKTAGEVHGVRSVLPATAVLWTAGFLAITGTPPFGPFLSKLVVLKAALDAGRPVVAALYLLSLLVVFVGMALAMLGMVQPGASTGTRRRESLDAVLPPALLLGLVLALGLHLPAPLETAIEEAARFFGGP